MMTFTSYPFDNQDTSENQYSALFRELQSSGVVGAYGDTTLKVTANASAMAVTLSTGSAIVRGFFFNNDANYTIAINSPGSAVRYDAVILRLDPAANSIVPVYVPGAGATPALTQTDTGIYEILLAVVTVNPGAVTIASTDVAEKRQYVGRNVRVAPSTNRPTAPRVYDLSVVPDLGGRIQTYDGATWNSKLAHHWGSGNSFPTSGLGVGDTYQHTGLNSLMRWNGTAWRQLERAEVATTLLRDSISSSYPSLLYVGFQCSVPTTGIVYEWQGVTTGWTMPWASAWGLVSKQSDASVTTATPAGNSNVGINVGQGSSPTNHLVNAPVTYYANRRYRVAVSGQVYSPNAGGAYTYIQYFQLTDSTAANGLWNSKSSGFRHGNWGYFDMMRPTWEVVWEPTTTYANARMRVMDYTTLSNGSIYWDPGADNFLVITDIGPNGAPL